MEHILIIGRYPPPTGGNTVHIQRLAQRLHMDGNRVTIADLYSRTPTSPSVPFKVLYREPGLRGGLSLLRGLSTAARGAIVHVHISAGATVYTIAPVLLWAIRHARKRVLTIHSGSWAKEFTSLSNGMRRLALFFLSRFDDVICVNDHQRSVVESNVHTRTHVIPAYLPCVPGPSVTVPASVLKLKREVDCLLITSGLETSTYEYQTLLDAVGVAQRNLNVRLGLVICTYGPRDPDYWDPVEEAIGVTTVPVVQTRNLSPEQFVRTLSACNIYVRPTTTDGDAVALREAALLGLQILASDTAVRPIGSATFPISNVQALAELVITAVTSPSLGRLSPDQMPVDHYPRISGILRPN